MITSYKKLFLRLGHCWTLLFSLFLWVSIVTFIPTKSAEPLRISLAQTTNSESVHMQQQGQKAAASGLDSSIPVKFTAKD